MSDLKCPRCNSSKLKRDHWINRLDGSRVMQYRCKSCHCSFLEKYRQTCVDIPGISCPQCGSSKVGRSGFGTYLDGSQVQRYQCKSCKRSFPSTYRLASAQPAEGKCPQCGSFNTVKEGKPTKTLHSTVQRCKCKDCSKQFNLGGRKALRVFLRGKEIHKCWDPPGLQFVPGITCPACGEEKAVLSWTQRSGAEQGRKILVCFGCGRQFKESASWNTQLRRRLGEAVPRQLWKFEEDFWDVRELYPNIEEHEFKQIFLNFSDCGSHWFSNLTKYYVLYRIQGGSRQGSLNHYISSLSRFGRFLQKEGITLMEEINRLLLETYWSQEQGHLSRNKLNNEMGRIKAFFDWGNTEKHFIVPSTLITTFDRPKLFYDEPDPLEDHVLETIRDNLHILPQPLQLMFMLGFWLGTRPSRLERE